MEFSGLFVSLLIMKASGSRVKKDKLTGVNEPATLYGQNKITTADIINLVKKELGKDNRVAKAWIYGSYARQEQHQTSDLDLVVELKDDEKYSLLDLIDIAQKIELKTNIKIDLAEVGTIKPFAMESSLDEMTLIYG